MKKLTIILSILLVLGSSCDKFLSENEKNPNSASAVPANLVLPAAINATAFNMTNPDNYSFISLWYGLWSVSGGYSQPTSLTQYKLLNSSYQGNWSSAYINLQNYDYIEKTATGSVNKPYRAIAKIMKAYVFQGLVDTYGNIPYKQALKGSSTTQVLKPAYDNQQEIYEDLVIQLDSAMNLITSLSADAAEVGDYDMVYHGDMGMWLKFANTIKLRMLVNQTGMTGRASYITGALATTPHTASDYIGAGEGAWSNPGYLQSEGKMNPFWENFYKQDGSEQADGLGYYVAGQDAVEFLSDNDDPRKTLIFRPYSGTNIRGNHFGAVVLEPVPTTSRLGSGLLQSFDQAAPLMTEWESLFLQAEAVAKGLITGDAKALYQTAVTESILHLGGSAGEAAAYLGQAGKPLVNYDESTNKVQTIITQKWISLIGLDLLPVWTDFRRTGFPNFLTWSADPAKRNTTPPVRMLYPQTEINTNSDNVDAQGTIDEFSTKIFWQNR
jgi:hypothetical protein